MPSAILLLNECAASQTSVDYVLCQTDITKQRSATLLEVITERIDTTPRTFSTPLYRRVIQRSNRVLCCNANDIVFA